ncbi:MAG: pyruvate formate lyase family protein [Clostridia bacterium]|nr:pyruvate formate lyase family protein [Clostridia bacterium]
MNKTTDTTQKFNIFKIQRTCVHDGPGLRTTIFFQGCALRCLWCQNPEGLSAIDGVSHEYTAQDVLSVVLRDKKYFRASGGGVTLSGGEPLLQDADALETLLKALKEEQIHIAIETTLCASWDTIEKLNKYIDLYYVDIKAGSEKLHQSLTGTGMSLIQKNLRQLVALHPTIRFRMVSVPGYNDSEDNIAAVSAILKEYGYNTIEILKYNSMYKDKANKLNLKVHDIPATNEQALESLRNTIYLFVKNGIKAISGETDNPPQQAVFTDRVLRVRDAIRSSKRALCIEVSMLKTKFYRKNGFKKPVHLHRAERLAYVLKNKTVKVYPDELLAGNFTSKRVAGQVWEEHYGILDISFLYKINRQKPVSFQCSFKERLKFYFYIFPFWFKHSLLRKVNPTIKDFIPVLARSSEMIAGFNNNMAAIAHFVVNFERLLTLGTTGIIAEINEAKRAHPDNNQEFYNGAILALQALEAFGERYACLLETAAKAEPDFIRKQELSKMSAICRRVPKYPAETFHEALQSMLLLQIALCIESYENAVSFGRIDQILYPYYKKDIESGKITYDEAKELLCLFILKMDECILVNDGDSYLNVSKLFETLSTDQALTFGGVDKDGNDAVNDITYMLIDACELQPLAINMTARVHEKNPSRYLERLAEIYINGCPMPELFADNIYIETLLRHYDTTIEQARNFSIVGCVEPNASDDHFGNTDCANMNLALPLLQALKGHDYDLWNYPVKEQLQKIIIKFIDYTIKGKNPLSRAILKYHRKKIRKLEVKKGIYQYNPPATMKELLERFQTRLNALAKGVLTDHQNIESKLRAGFTTPLASALYQGCIQSGKDVYEGGATFNSSGIQAVGITDVADSLFAVDEVVFKKKLYTMTEVLEAIDNNFEGAKHKAVREALLAVPKFGDDCSLEATQWVTKVMEIYNKALDSVPNCPRNGVYTAGYYALNVNDRYGKKTQALPCGRLAGVPLANSVTPHYGMQQTDLFSSLNAVAGVNFTDYAVNGTTVTFSIDSALFQGEGGVKNLASVFKTFLTTGGMQFQPNVINRDILIEAYAHPEKYPYLMVRVAGYCAYFNELSDELKQIIINRTCYSF